MAEKLSRRRAKVEEKVGEDANESDEREETIQNDEVDPGQREARRLQDPRLPSEDEVRRHCLNHMPYRSWCPHCVRGRGREMDHRKVKKDGDEAEIPEYHVDYCFPGDLEGERLTVLVVVERWSKMKKAVVVPAKGSSGKFAAGMVLEIIRECGDMDRAIIIKSDQEPAIKCLIDEVCGSRTR